MKKTTSEDFITKANEIWNNKFDYLEVVYTKSLTEVKVICPEHGPFMVKPQWHLQKSQCPECSKLVRKVAMTKFNQETKRLTTEEFIEKARNIHGDKYDYSKVVYVNATTKVIITCPEHGDFIQHTHHHLAGTGCPFCSNRLINVKNILTQKEFLERIKDIPNLSFEKTVYKDKREKVIVTCEIHGDYETTAEVLLKGCGCKKCASDKLSDDRIYSLDDFITKAKEIHGELYDYVLVDYKGIFENVNIICKKHKKVFSQSPASHLQGSGCPICKLSKGELQIIKILDTLNIVHDRQKTFCDLRHIQNLKFDFYLPAYNVLIEYDGEQHFKSIEYFGGEEAFKGRQLKDALKNEYCRINNIPLLRIKYSDTNMVELIDAFIKENSCI